MKYLKILGLAAVAAMAMMAFAGSASATLLTHEGVAMGAGDPLSASVTTSAHLKTGGGTTIATCTEGTVGGTITNGGGASATVSGNINTLTWGGCNTTVDTLATGTLELHSNGIVTSNGAKVTINFIGVSCIFETKNTSIGSLVEGKPGKFEINGTIPGVSGFPCPGSGIWSGGYTVTNPTGTLAVD